MHDDMNNWEALVCSSTFCRADMWLVRASQKQSDLWHVASVEGSSAWLVAAAEPVCPLCGITLRVAACIGVLRPG